MKTSKIALLLSIVMVFMLAFSSCGEGKGTEGLEFYPFPDGTYGVKAGQKISQKQAEEFLKDDLKTFEAAVNNYVKVPLTQGQFDALVSFSFNVGNEALRTSTLLNKRFSLSPWHNRTKPCLKNTTHQRLQELILLPLKASSLLWIL